MILKKNFIYKLKACCFYNDNNRYDSIGTKSQKNVIELEVEGLPPHLLEQSSTHDNEILTIKNILKIGTPLPLEPSLYSPIHLSGEKKKN